MIGLSAGVSGNFENPNSVDLNSIDSGNVSLGTLGTSSLTTIESAGTSDRPTKAFTDSKLVDKSPVEIKIKIVFHI